MQYEAVIGLEVHVQVKTRSKMFTRVAAGYGHEPNTLTDPVVLALPGVSRAEGSPSGLTVFLRGDADPDAIVRGVLQQVHISGFRVRAADLAEVFRVLDPAGKGTTGE